MSRSAELDRDLILRAARSWIGTRFHFAGRIRKNTLNRGGIDCIGLIVKVGGEIGACSGGKNLESYDYLTYSRYPNFGEMKEFMDRHFLKISENAVDIGDIMYFNFAGGLEHTAIVSDYGIIHCYLEAKSVVEHIFTDYWKKKVLGFYRYVKN
ncbi:MAG: DUF1287 domain-containing protein [Rickettsiales bacterium]|jgi:cell wall-associated NlpC family hydrolase|nr:DUF1287 domain-containing protein [Rickettsiales bacterium]